MSRFLVATNPLAGHVGPAWPIVTRLIARGHEVAWYCGRRYQAKIESSGARFYAFERALDYDDRDLDATFPDRKGLKGLASFKYGVKQVFLANAPRQLADLEHIVSAFPADVILTEPSVPAPRWLHEKGGPPWTCHSISALFLPSPDVAPFGLALAPKSGAAGRLRNRALYFLLERVLFRDVAAFANTLRASVGLPAEDASFLAGPLSPYLYLQGSPPSFEYPRSDLPPQVHFIGPLMASTTAMAYEKPAWWPELEQGRPVVHVTQGTLETDPHQLLVPAIEALEHEDVLVVAVTGGPPVEQFPIRSLPANVRLETFVPHAHLLPHVDVMVTNAGFNGVMGALAHGVPLVAAGRTQEKPEICARIAWSGAGIDLKSESPEPARIREAVRRVLSDSSYRTRARRFAEECAQYDAPERAAALLERLAATGAPVHREEV